MEKRSYTIRKFDGVEYNLRLENLKIRDRSTAQKMAREYRDRGIKARVIKVKGGYNVWSVKKGIL